MKERKYEFTGKTVVRSHLEWAFEAMCEDYDDANARRRFKWASDGICEDYGDTNEPIEEPKEDVILHQIRALRSFGDVEAGEVGGYILCEENLSHEGSCWVYPGSEIMGMKTRIFNSAKIKDSVIDGDCKIHGNTHICECVIDSKDGADISGSASVEGTRIAFNPKIEGNSKIQDSDIIAGHLSGNVQVKNSVIASIDSNGSSSGLFSGNARIINSRTYDDVIIRGNVVVENCAIEFAAISGTAFVSDTFISGSRKERIKIDK